MICATFTRTLVRDAGRRRESRRADARAPALEFAKTPNYLGPLSVVFDTAGATGFVGTPPCP
jgi:hypothetical protein